MHHLELSLNDAYDFVKKCKRDISPNFNFMGQLKDFETNLNLSRGCSCNKQNSDSPVPCACHKETKTYFTSPTSTGSYSSMSSSSATASSSTSSTSATAFDYEVPPTPSWSALYWQPKCLMTGSTFAHEFCADAKRLLHSQGKERTESKLESICRWSEWISVNTNCFPRDSTYDVCYHFLIIMFIWRVQIVSYVIFFSSFFFSMSSEQFLSDCFEICSALQRHEQYWN